MMKKNDLVVEGNIISDGDISVGNNIENQTNNIYTIDIKQLEEYIKKDIALTLSEQQLVAKDRANHILADFSDKILPKLVKAEMINVFSDPAVQIFFRTEQKSALCSSRENDLEILSEMLIYRIRNKSSIEKKASISRAVDVINNVSDSALAAITIHYLLNFHPVSGDINHGLKVLDDIYKQLLEHIELPKTNEWLDNLEILGLIRINTFSSTKTLEEIYFERLDGYCVKGIKKDAEEYNSVINKLKSNNIPLDILVDHILNPGYVRLNVINEQQIDDIFLVSQQIKDNQVIEVKQVMSNEQKNVLKEIYSCSRKEKDCDALIKQNLSSKISEFKSLNIILKWWNNNLQPAISINSVGRVIAHTNIKGIIEDIPDMV